MKEKHTRKRNVFHKIILAVLISLSLVSGVWVIAEMAENYKAQQEYESLAQLVRQTEPEPFSEPETEEETKKDTQPETQRETQRETQPPYVSPIDFEELARINPDVVGWIRIPGTNIDYPIVQGETNDTYLHRSFEGEETAAGSIFLDFASQRDLRGYNNIFYGHHMRNGSMFRDIVYYKEEEYFKEHQYFELYTPKETIHLKAVSCYYIKNDPTVRRTRFKSREAFQEFVRKMIEPCSYGEIPEEPVKNLYTFVTCSYEVDDGRTVLFAVEADPDSRETEPSSPEQESSSPEAEEKNSVSG